MAIAARYFGYRCQASQRLRCNRTRAHKNSMVCHVIPPSGT
jgi:hypothetical protein